MMRHTIRIHASAEEPGRYAVSGAAQIEDTDSPIRDAAAAILALGADDRDTLHVIGPVSIADMPLHRLAGDYRPPRKSDVARQARH